MSNIIQFPSVKSAIEKALEQTIEKSLVGIEPEYKGILKEEGLKTFKEHEIVFENVALDLPDTMTEKQLSTLKNAFEEEKKKKYTLITQIMHLKMKALYVKLVNEKI